MTVIAPKPATLTMPAIPALGPGGSPFVEAQTFAAIGGYHGPISRFPCEPGTQFFLMPGERWHAELQFKCAPDGRGSALWDLSANRWRLREVTNMSCDMDEFMNWGHL